MNTLLEIKETVNELLIKNDFKLYILIDDLDRLTPKEITLLFKILKVNLNILNTFFIIAYDKEVVINALENEYKFNGEKYLEKIIQVDFTIPPILEKQITAIFFDRLSEYLNKVSLILDLDDLRSIWRLHGFKEYFKSIRDINRYFNNLVFTLPNIGNNINIQDFLLLEAIRTFDNLAYHKAYNQIILIKRKAIWQSIAFDESAIRDFKNETTRSILNVLFLRDYSSKNATTGKRLKDPSYFERYFSLTVPDNDVTEENITNFFTSGSNKVALLNGIHDAGKMENFLKRISAPDFVIEIKSNDLGIFRDFLTFWNSHSYSIDGIYNNLVTDSYINLIRLCEDKFKATNIALNELSLESSEVKRMAFVINYNIQNGFLKYTENEILTKINNKKESLKTHFLKYLIDNKGFCFFGMCNGEANWIDRIFLNALAYYLPDEYKENLATHINNPQVLSFIISSFLLTDIETGQAGSLSLDHAPVLLPEHFLPMAIREIPLIQKGTLREMEFNNLQFFVNSISKQEN